MILVLSDDTKQDVGNRFYESLKKAGVETEYISVNDLEVKPCYGCGGCFDKTYGKCILHDDMDKVLSKMVCSDTLLFVTPITFGSYSYPMKKVMDRMAVIGDIHYYFNHGELTKGFQDNSKKFSFVGVKNHCKKEEKAAFERLVHENIKIMNVEGNTFVIENTIEDSKVEDMVKEVLTCPIH